MTVLYHGQSSKIPMKPVKSGWMAWQRQKLAKQCKCCFCNLLKTQSNPFNLSQQFRFILKKNFFPFPNDCSHFLCFSLPAGCTWEPCKAALRNIVFDSKQCWTKWERTLARYVPKENAENFWTRGYESSTLNKWDVRQSVMAARWWWLPLV